MTDRDRLIELLEDTLHEWECNVQSETLSQIAEHLLANGVILPPCKVGQKLYDIGEFVLGVVAPEIYELKADEMTIEKGIDGALNFVYDGMYINNEDMGETLFLTKEEAEARLKERDT